MGPTYKISRQKPSSLNSTKRTVKYLAVCQDPRVLRIVLRSADDSVYKSICNAFFNIAENPDITLSKDQRKLLKKHNPVIRTIITPQIPIKRKRQVIQRGGGAFLAAVIPAVLSAAISLLGSAFMKKE